jgi:transglutaminase-like putative cysteine protease
MFLSSTSVFGQKFQEPTKEELQMTSDRLAPDAPAVFLDREETTDNQSHYISGYARIKVLTEKGKDWATVELPHVAGFSATPIVEGRTIHADGTVIPLVGKVSDLLIYKTDANQVKAAFFNMPSVEVGSILEYKWLLPVTGIRTHRDWTTDDEEYEASALAFSVPEWEVQQSIPIHRERFYFNPFSTLGTNPGGEHNTIDYYEDGEQASYLLFTQRLPAGAHVNKSPKGDYTLELRDVPAIRRESNSIPINSTEYKVGFYYTPYVTAADFWANEGKRLGRELDKYANQSPKIKSAAAEMVAGADTPEAKARKIYDAVQALDNTDFSRTKTRSERRQLHLRRQVKNAENVWEEKSGSGNDLASLYLALVRASGLEAFGLKVVDRSERMFDSNYLSLRQLDALLVVVRIDGKEIYLDPGEKLCPFGQLHWSHTLAGGIAENLNHPVVTPQNLSKDGITAHRADLTIDAQGFIKGSVKIVMNGPEALRWRQLNLTSSPDEVKHEFNEVLRKLLPQGIAGDLDHFQALDTSATNLGAFVNVSGQLGTVTGKRVVVPAFFFNSDPRTQFVNETSRESAIDLHYAEQVIDDVVFHFPDGFTVEGAPPAEQLPWSNQAAVVVKTTSAPGTIEIKQIFARGFVMLDPKEYSSLLGFYRKLAAADQQQLILVKNAGAGG